MPDQAVVVHGKLDTSYGATSVVTWLLFDTLVHFDVEVDCIWRRPTTWVKWAYAFVRYIPILNGGAVLTLGSDRTYPSWGCRVWVVDQFVVMELVTMVTEVILMARVYAMYRQNKIILAAISSGFVAEVVLMIATLAVVIPRQGFTPGCMITSSPAFFVTYWISSLCFETVLFSLTLIKFFENVKLERNQHSILFVFVRDGTWAFAIIFAAMLLNLLLYKLVHTPLAGMGYFWAIGVMSMAGSHVLLNIRRLGGFDDLRSTTMQFTSIHPSTTTGSDLLSTLSDSDCLPTPVQGPPRTLRSKTRCSTSLGAITEESEDCFRASDEVQLVPVGRRAEV